MKSLCVLILSALLFALPACAQEPSPYSQYVYVTGPDKQVHELVISRLSIADSFRATEVLPNKEGELRYQCQVHLLGDRATMHCEGPWIKGKYNMLTFNTSDAISGSVVMLRHCPQWDGYEPFSVVDVYWRHEDRLRSIAAHVTYRKKHPTLVCH